VGVERPRRAAAAARCVWKAGGWDPAVGGTEPRSVCSVEQECRTAAVNGGRWKRRVNESRVIEREWQICSFPVWLAGNSTGADTRKKLLFQVLLIFFYFKNNLLTFFILTFLTVFMRLCLCVGYIKIRHCLDPNFFLVFDTSTFIFIL